MAKSLKPLFSTTLSEFDFTNAAAATDVNGVLLKNDHPPGEASVASICISNTASGSAQTATVKCQLYFGPDTGYGTAHTVLNDAGVGTFALNSTTVFEANLYGQAWWKENWGFRIVVSRGGSSAFNGNAAAVLR